MTNPDDLARVIVLLFGKMDHGGPFWCYVAVKPSQYPDFQAAERAGAIDIYSFDAFGEIICSAEGERPPAHVTDEVARMYGADARTFFQDIDPLSEIDKKIKDHDDKSRLPENSPGSWSSRFGRKG